MTSFLRHLQQGCPILFLVVCVTGCSSARRPTPADACDLLKAGEVAISQGAMPVDSQGSVHSGGGVTITQCFYSLPGNTGSVALEVTRPDRLGRRATCKIWNQRFGKGKSEGEEEERRERGEAGESKRESGQSREVHAIPVEGVGDAAAWTGNRVSGALYVLTRFAILRISLGGPGDVNTKIDGARRLAQKAIPRL